MAAMKQTSSGSLLTGDQLAQVIVPLGKVICTLGYKLSWTSQVCELIGPDGSTLPLTLNNGCPEACMALDRAPFFDFKEMLKERLVTRPPKEGIWEWDPPAVERPYEAAKHLAFVGDMVYVNVNRLLFENEFPEVWRVLQWAALQGRLGTIVSRDAPAKPLEQVAAGPHRCMVHFVHALSSAARELQGGGVTHLYVEDLAGNYDMNHYQTKYGDNLWPPWTLCKDSIAYYEEMGLSEVSIERFAGDCVLRVAKLSSDAAWRLHVARNHQPFRRDCSVCVRNSAAGHQHRTTMHPMAYSLSVDVVGPLKGFGKSPDGKFFKYFVIGAMRVPRIEGAGGHGEVRGCGGALETTPVLKAVPFPSGTPLSGAHGEDDEVGVATTHDCETTLWEWAIYAETPPPDEQDGVWPCRSVCLKKLCSSDDPGPELEVLTKVPAILAEEECDPLLQRDMEMNVEHWTSMGLYDFPKVAKLEPEYVEGIAKAVIEKWRPAITKELGVVERGFKKVTTAEVMALKEKFTVQASKEKLLSVVGRRIVCCGNYAAEDQSPGQIVYIIRPPAALVQLGLAHPGERWKMRVPYQDKFWVLRQGTAEPNMWLIYEVLDVDHEIRFLGCEIAVTEDYDAVFIHQRPYIDEILRHHATPATDLSPIQSPKELVTFEAKEGEDPGSEEEVRQAQRACGELLWVAQRSRPDISFVVCAMGSLLTRAAPRCLTIATKLRSYLQRTKNLALALKPTNDEFTIYTDSSFAPEGSKSHSGMVAVWLGAPVCWRSSKQPFICLSTAECELLAATTEGLVMGKSIESVLNQMMKDVGKIYLKVDNQAAISFTRPSSSVSWRTRHLRVRASYIVEQVDKDQVEVVFVAGKSQWADLLTKSFPRQRLEELVGLWGFVDVVAEVSKVTMARMLVACMMVQTARAQEDDPLSLTTSFDLYIMVVLLGIAVVVSPEIEESSGNDSKGDRAADGRKKHGSTGIITYGEDTRGRLDYSKNTVGILTYYKDTKADDTYHEDAEACDTYFEETYTLDKDLFDSGVYYSDRTRSFVHLNGVLIIYDCAWTVGYEFPIYYKRGRGPD
ncbi:unnamed protein product [Symbiodinium necroappetens]|uniref:Copia protein n=1 Tax=Symbiodinium necroappetens TaxID=1628268 RepID=A0A812VIP4_9DINO|nr:unnamed protein product [Symbiodinium necroappetens]